MCGFSYSQVVLKNASDFFDQSLDCAKTFCFSCSTDKGTAVMVVVSKITHNEVCENKVFATMLF